MIEKDIRFLQLTEQSIKNNWDLPAFSDYKGATFHYKDVARRIAKFHIILNHLDIKKGDKIALIGRNSPQWAIYFFGTITYGAVIVPILHEFKPDNIHHIVNHSEAKLLMVTDHIWENLNEEMMPDLIGAIKLEDLSIAFARNEKLFELRAHLNEEFGKKYPMSFTAKDVVYYKEQPDELAIINYTSGTTGSSKGVMIPYRAIIGNVTFGMKRLDFKAGDNIVCMLPLAHTYGLSFELLLSFVVGMHIHFLTRTPSPRIIAEAFTTIKPKIIIAVPLIIEKIIKNNVFPELEKPWMKLLTKLPVVDKQIFNRIAQKLEASFGGNFIQVIIGGAALSKDVEAFLKLINFRFTVGYGMTECAPLITYAVWNEFALNSSGRAIDGMSIRIDNKENNDNGFGEIQVKGQNVMLGYYKNEKETQAAFTEDGWLRTGDLGTIDEKGNLFIKGRRKTMILGASGQNIYPEEIEGILNNMIYVAESLIVQRGNKLHALIYPDWDTLSKQKIRDNTEKIMEENIKQLNQQIPTYSKISDFTIFYEEFEKTPKRSIKRYLYH